MNREKSDICPCAKCSPETRQSCCGCPEYGEWVRRNYTMKEDTAKIAIHVEDSDVKRNSSDWEQYSNFQSKYMYNEDMDMAMDNLDLGKYGSGELDLLASVNELIRKYFDDTHNDGWWTVVNGKSYPDPFTPVLVTIRDDTGDSPYIYTDVASYTGGTDGFWISNNEPVCGDVVAWMKFPRPAEVR